MSFQKNNITGKLAAIQALDDTVLKFGKNSKSADEKVLGKSRNPFDFLVSLLTFIEGDGIIQEALVEITGRVFTDAEGKVKGFLQNIVDDELPDGGDGMDNIIAQKPLEFSPNAFNHNNRLRADLSNDPCKQSVLAGGGQNATSGAFKAIQNPGTNQSISGNGSAVSFDSNSGLFSFLPNSNKDPKNYLKEDLIGSSQILDKNELLGEVFNIVTGFLEKGKSKDEIVEQEKYYAAVKKIIENDEEDDSYFEFSDEELLEIDRLAESKAFGVYDLNFGCSIEGVALNGDDLCNLLNGLDPADKAQTQQFYDGVYGSIEDNNDLPDDADSNTARASFFRRLIDALILAIVVILLANPIFMMVLLVIVLLTGGDTNLGGPLDILKRFISFVKCIIGDIRALIVEYLFDIVKRIILNLIKTVTSQIIQEKLKLFLQQLRSLLIPLDIPI